MATRRVLKLQHVQHEPISRLKIKSIKFIRWKVCCPMRRKRRSARSRWVAVVQAKCQCHRCQLCRRFQCQCHNRQQHHRLPSHQCRCHHHQWWYRCAHQLYHHFHRINSRYHRSFQVRNSMLPFLHHYSTLPHLLTYQQSFYPFSWSSTATEFPAACTAATSAKLHYGTIDFHTRWRATK